MPPVSLLPSGRLRNTNQRSRILHPARHCRFCSSRSPSAAMTRWSWQQRQKSCHVADCIFEVTTAASGLMVALVHEGLLLLSCCLLVLLEGGLRRTVGSRSRLLLSFMVSKNLLPLLSSSLGSMEGTEGSVGRNGCCREEDGTVGL